MRIVGGLSLCRASLRERSTLTVAYLVRRRAGASIRLFPTDSERCALEAVRALESTKIMRSAMSNRVGWITAMLRRVLLDDVFIEGMNQLIHTVIVEIGRFEVRAGSR